MPPATPVRARPVPPIRENADGTFSTTGELYKTATYKKTVNARAEKLNRHKARELIGYVRIDDEECAYLLNQVYRYLNLLTNFFVVGTRIESKKRNPATGKTRKKYDKARTPYKRVQEHMKEGRREENLIAPRKTLDPIDLQEKIQKSFKRLFAVIMPECFD